ncbi:MAG: DEAD/DEAH box helicase [Acidobacteria bacterium]|nr:DEAD/DEAH box helicase [Acidobacteriota bacterium]
MDVFALRDALVADYESYIRSFINIRDEQIRTLLDRELSGGLLWPEPLVQLNPSFEPGEPIADLVAEGILHGECERIFRKKDERGDGPPLRLHRHQVEAIRAAHRGANYVLTTGTGSGKSLAYIVPIVDHVLRHGSGRGIQAIVVYPMNALANSQRGELEKFLCRGYPEGRPPVTFARYTGQESHDDRQHIIGRPPDILLTNYVMLELILTRPAERALVQGARGLRFLVLDELHTYRGRQGADVAMLVRRAREAFGGQALQCVGTSATLAGPGTLDEQRARIAELASGLFGAPVGSADVIGETLRRSTPEHDTADAAFRAELRDRLLDPELPAPQAQPAFCAHPLSVWVEGAFGIAREAGSGRLVRRAPRAIGGADGAARELAEATGLDEERCASGLRHWLLASQRALAGDGSPAFAFRLHQFVGKGDAVYATFEGSARRHVTLHGQVYVPGDRERRLYPLVFCRECGQEYASVYLRQPTPGGPAEFEPRDAFERRPPEEAGLPGFLALNEDDLWPTDLDHARPRLPAEWLDETGSVLKHQREFLPAQRRIAASGREAADGAPFVVLRAPFRFCLRCGVTYGGRVRSDFSKLASLASEGRSTATTILCLAAIRFLRDDASLVHEARKLLSFTDNRQDASLQAGHFNDFIEVGLLRAAVYRAAAAAGPDGLEHDSLAQQVFTALDLPLDLYAYDPAVRGPARKEVERALRDVLGYRVYRDLERGWRVTSPNLEQCGLLEIRYDSLAELCADDGEWASRHPALATASPATRETIAHTLLDFMRRELAIEVDYLEADAQDRIRQRSSQALVPPWGLDDNEQMERASILFPRSERKGDYGGWVFLSARSGFGQYLRRPGTLPESAGALSVEDTQHVIADLLETLRGWGFVARVAEPERDGDVAGYRLRAQVMRWVAGDGTRPYHDPIRVPRQPAQGLRANPFFVDFYRSVARALAGLEAHEHTAQVPAAERAEREDRFRQGRLPILYCSPTMELGVDIADLNVVNLRNVPPTPANYAQRGGRAGRGGQPALVFTYCTAGSPHDQYFFKRPELMVSGAVSPPRLDLANEDLLRAHVQALWLAASGLDLGGSLADILSVQAPRPTLELNEKIRAALEDPRAREHTLARGQHLLQGLGPDLDRAGWHSPDWLERTVSQVPAEFERACERWRGLYRSAREQAERQDAVVRDHTRSHDERAQAERLRREAEAQMNLLVESGSAAWASDFYSYRYFASEGFLPGYSFPRLPLSAFIPGRRRGRDEFLSRPRFLAITEFGPRAFVYHEGSRYVINRVVLPIGEDGVAMTRAKLCPGCGYLHPLLDDETVDLCQRCELPLGEPITALLRLTNVSTRRRDRISSDEEERQRQGYEVWSAFHFASRGGTTDVQAAVAESGGRPLAALAYAQAATIWRINIGRRRRADRDQLGFVLDLERGTWAKSQDDDADDPDDPTGPLQARVIPFVEDRRNALVFEPSAALGHPVMAGLAAALKSAIQARYQLEDSELAVVLLPKPEQPRLILFYEAAEGGAGVLRRLVEDVGALGAVARDALEICHFDPDIGTDRRRAPHAREDCEAACYDCLLSYGNQPDHRVLDRHAIRDLLLGLAGARVSASPSRAPRGGHLQMLLNQCQSELEREWLRFLDERELALPTRAQARVEGVLAQPDFVYDREQTVIYVDGPHHEFAERAARDRQQETALHDLGFSVVRFGLRDDWTATVRRYPSVFGRLAEGR